MASSGNERRKGMNIKKTNPFDGKPQFHMASVYGAATGKEILFRLPITGKRPIAVSADSLPNGLTLNDRILSGKITEEQDITIRLTAKNELGEESFSFVLRIRDGLSLVTPLVGFCTWNAFGSAVTQEDVCRSADWLIESGLADYGYSYVNLDSGWQGVYGGEYDAIMPNEKFPNMRKMTEHIHSYGLKAGIYSTPMLTAWGCPKEFSSIPGCTVGEPDLLYTCVNGGIGKDRREENNVRQWDDWQFDYVKYDWAPADPSNADPMKKALDKASRSFSYCVTPRASDSYGPYWQRNCNAWRDNDDSIDEWNNVKRRFFTVDRWKPYVGPGHFYDLDMLEIGRNAFWDGENRLTEDEILFAYSLRAFFLSPIQVSTPIEGLTEWEKDVLCNDEMLRLNQDALCDYPTCIASEHYSEKRIFRRNLENGDFAFAVFNASDESFDGLIALEKPHTVLDVWTGESVENTCALPYHAEPHSVRIFRVICSE